jgi:hypothetical protein
MRWKTIKNPGTEVMNFFLVDSQSWKWKVKVVFLSGIILLTIELGVNNLLLFDTKVNKE